MKDRHTITDIATAYGIPGQRHNVTYIATKALKLVPVEKMAGVHLYDNEQRDLIFAKLDEIAAKRRPK